MLTSLLGAIQSAFASFTRGFLIVALVPTILFLAANLAILSAVNWAWYSALKVGTFSDGLATTLWTVGVAAAALVLSALQPLLYRLTEGEALPAVMRWYGHSVQRYRLDCMHEQAKKIADLYTGIDGIYDGWMANLALPPRNIGGAIPSGETLKLVHRLDRRRQIGWEISFSEIQNAVHALHVDLTAGGAAATPLELREARRELSRIIRYARDSVKYENRTVHNQLQASFPGQVFDPKVSTDNILAPAGFGNIGRTMRSYALRRYGMDLDIFWTRLQKSHGRYHEQDARQSGGTEEPGRFSRVNMLWLTLLTGIVWTPALWIEGAHPVLFVGVSDFNARAGMAALRDASCRAYLVFADQLRHGGGFLPHRGAESAPNQRAKRDGRRRKSCGSG